MNIKHVEIEHRFIGPAMRIPDGLHGTRIVQGYFQTPDHQTIRIRKTNGSQYELTTKIGFGKKRKELTIPIPSHAMGEELLAACPYILRKMRYTRNKWEINRYIGPLTGLIVLEREMRSAAEPLVLPEWLDPTLYVEVTNTVTNYDLAQLAKNLQGVEHHPPAHALLTQRKPIIVLTGGPCSGKSSIMKLLQREFGTSLFCVPETASIILNDVGVKFPVGNGLYERNFQQHVYTVQRSFELLGGIQATLAGSGAIVVDRGSVDNAAYLRGGTREFARVCSTNLRREFERYAAVICLGVPSAAVYAQESSGNLARYETYEQAVATGERTHAAWAKHPNFRYLEGTWAEKVEGVRSVLQQYSQ